MKCFFVAPRRVSLFGHGRTSQTGEKSTALFESDNIGDDQHSGNHGVDLSGESDNGKVVIISFKCFAFSPIIHISYE